MNAKKWTTLYDNGLGEEIRIHTEDNGSLEWEYRDLAGALEEWELSPTSKAKSLVKWLATHKIDSDSFSENQNAKAWEEILEENEGSTIANIVDEIRSRRYFRG